MTRLFARRLFTLLALLPAPVFAATVTYGHHGGLIVNCTAPVFLEEFPAKDAKLARVDRIAFTASENTDPETLKAWVNAQPVAIKVERQRSGRYRVTGDLPAPITEGRAWIKASGVSDDGCDDLFTWNVYAGQ